MRGAQGASQRESAQEATRRRHGAGRWGAPGRRWRRPGGDPEPTGAEQLAASIPPTSGAPSMPAMRSDAGREAEVIGGWQLVMSRKGPRRPALAASAFKPPPISRWLFRRCCRCLVLGHRASICREPICCSRCLLPSKRAQVKGLPQIVEAAPLAGLPSCATTSTASPCCCFGSGIALPWAWLGRSVAAPAAADRGCAG